MAVQRPSGAGATRRKLPDASVQGSNLGLFRDLQSVVNLDAEIAYGTFKLGMAEEKLNRS